MGRKRGQWRDQHHDPDARDTQGTLLTATAGTEERGSAAARYGGKLGDSGFFRVFGQYSERDATFHPSATTSDDWRIGHAGFRADWDASSSDTLTLQGDLYRANIGQFAPAINVIGRPGPTGNLEVHATGGNVLGRWRHQLASGSDLQLRAYFDRTHRNDPELSRRPRHRRRGAAAPLPAVRTS